MADGLTGSVRGSVDSVLMARLGSVLCVAVLARPALSTLSEWIELGRYNAVVTSVEVASSAMELLLRLGIVCDTIVRSLEAVGPAAKLLPELELPCTIVKSPGFVGPTAGLLVKLGLPCITVKGSEFVDSTA